MSARRIREIAALGAIAVVAALLRWQFVLTGLWRDEAATYFETTATTVAGALREIRLAEISPPGYFLLMRGWIALTGVSDFAYKFPSFVFGLATVLLTYALARRLRTHGAGLIAASLATVTFSGVMLSGTARPYALAAALTAALATAALATLRTGSWRSAAGYALLAYAVMNVQYTGIVVVVTIGCVAALQAFASERRRGSLALVAASIVAGIAYVPQLPLFLHTAAVSVPWLPAMTRQSLAGRTIEQFTYVLPFEVARTALALECVVPALVLALVYRRRLLVSDYPILILPVFAATLLETKALLLHPRYMYAFSPLADAVLGAALVALVTRVRALVALRPPDAAAWAIGAYAIALVATLALAVPKQAGIDVATLRAPALSGMRDVARELPAAFDSKTLVVVAPDYLGPTYAYYARHAATAVVGFPHRTNPQFFRWDGYGDAWQKTGVVESGERYVLDRFDARYTRLALLTDPRVIDRGTVRYSLVRAFQYDLERHLSVIDRQTFPGRDEAVAVTLFTHVAARGHKRPSRSRT